MLGNRRQFRVPGNFRAYSQNWAGGEPQDIFGDRPQQELAQPRPAMRPQNNQVNVVFRKDCGERVPHLPVANVTAVRYVLQRGADLLHALLGLIFRVVVDGSHTDVVDAAGHHEQACLGKSMEEMQCAAKTPANGGGIRQRGVGRGGEIGCEQNVLDRYKRLSLNFGFSYCAGRNP